MTKEKEKCDEDNSFRDLIIFLAVCCYVTLMLVMLFANLLDTWGTQRHLDYIAIFLYPTIGAFMAGLMLYLFFYLLNRDLESSPNDDTGAGYPVHYLYFMSTRAPNTDFPMFHPYFMNTLSHKLRADFTLTIFVLFTFLPYCQECRQEIQKLLRP